MSRNAGIAVDRVPRPRRSVMASASRRACAGQLVDYEGKYGATGRDRG